LPERSKSYRRMGAVSKACRIAHYGALCAAAKLRTADCRRTRLGGDAGA
jgi:hypothetical protein